VGWLPPTPVPRFLGIKIVTHRTRRASLMRRLFLRFSRAFDGRFPPDVLSSSPARLASDDVSILYSKSLLTLVAAFPLYLPSPPLLLFLFPHVNWTCAPPRPIRVPSQFLPPLPPVWIASITFRFFLPSAPRNFGHVSL